VNNAADALTKAVNGENFVLCTEVIGIDTYQNVPMVPKIPYIDLVWLFKAAS
jgi:hypothetical protein